MFINESLTGFFLGRVERVNLSDIRDKRVFEFDGVIKGLMRGEDIVSLLEKTSVKSMQKSGTGISLGLSV